MKASSNSLLEVVDRADEVIVVLLLDRSVEVVASIPIAAEAVPENNIRIANPHSRKICLEAIPLQVEEIIFIEFPQRSCSISYQEK